MTTFLELSGLCTRMQEAGYKILLELTGKCTEEQIRSLQATCLPNEANPLPTPLVCSMIAQLNCVCWAIEKCEEWIADARQAANRHLVKHRAKQLADKVANQSSAGA